MRRREARHRVCMKMGGLGKGEKVWVKMYVYGVWTKVWVNEKSLMGTQNIGNNNIK